MTDKVVEMKRTIERLSIDPMFGILTRSALEIEIEKLDKFNCIFLDIDKLKKHNEKYGYNNVNYKLKIQFNKFKDICKATGIKAVVGRWFSGDEILIITNHLVFVNDLLAEQLDQINMSYKFRFIKNVNTVNDIENNITIL